jgi:hypothetical protein
MTRFAGYEKPYKYPFDNSNHVIAMVNIGLHFYPLHKAEVKENVTIEAVKEPSPFDNVVNDPYYNVPNDASGPTTTIQV